MIVNIADPGSPELLTPEDYASTLIDRRKFHTPMVENEQGKRVPYNPAERSWKKTRGFTLHQTACNLGERIERYDTLGAHFAILRSGRTLWMADENRIVYHGNGWNGQCVSVEFDGLFAGREDDPDTAQDERLKSTWDDPSTPTREMPMTPTPQQLVAGRQLVRYVRWKVAQNGGDLNVLCAHRQSSKSRRNDPGECIWKPVAVVLHAELGMTDGGIGFQIGGYPIPEVWDDRCKGIPY